MNNNLATRRKPGRSKKGKLSYEVNELSNKNKDKVRKELKSTTWIKYYGRQVVVNVADYESTIGVIRGSKYDQFKNDRVFNVYFEYNDLDKKYVWMSSEEVAEGLLKSYQSGVGGPSHHHSKNQLYNTDRNLTMVDNYNVPVCFKHKKLCKLLTVKKTNENHGRCFFRCKEVDNFGKQCGCFFWAEQYLKSNNIPL